MSHHIDVIEIASAPGSAVLELADALGQRKYLERRYPHASEQYLIAALANERADGFLLLLVQTIGREEGRTPIVRAGQPLSEGVNKGYVEAFGVRTERRRRAVHNSMLMSRPFHALEHRAPLI